jgi:hypothetical protein
LVVDGTTFPPFVLTGQLDRLDPLVLLDGESRFQLHISIGQAF